MAAQARRHDGGRRSAGAVGARGIARRRRPAASGRRRRNARPRYVRRRARSARARGLGCDDPSHEHDHARRRRFAGRHRQCGHRVAGHAAAVVARKSGKYRWHSAREGFAARVARGRWRRRQGRYRVIDDAALVRARHAPGIGTAQGVPPPQDTVRAGGGRIRRSRRAW